LKIEAPKEGRAIKIVTSHATKFNKIVSSVFDSANFFGASYNFFHMAADECRIRDLSLDRCPAPTNSRKADWQQVLESFILTKNPFAAKI
jgi:hypothetical protein